jgi:hypothetical protein
MSQMFGVIRLNLYAALPEHQSMHDYCGVVPVRSNMHVTADRARVLVMQESAFDLASYVTTRVGVPVLLTR